MVVKMIITTMLAVLATALDQGCVLDGGVYRTMGYNQQWEIKLMDASNSDDVLIAAFTPAGNYFDVSMG